MSAALVGYNPDDPLQSSFLAALALGESGGGSNTTLLGLGGTDLTGAPTDGYGFPKWTGLGNSHAAGTYQFQPQTWDSIASKFNLNFQNSSDQSQGAWMLAQQVFARKTGGSLEDALQNGEYGLVQKSLAGTWTSANGNQSAPQGLAATLAQYVSGGGPRPPSPPGSTASASPASGGGSGGGGGGGGGFLSGLWGGVTDQLSRIGLLMLGGIVIAAALWALLNQAGVAPSPRQIIKHL